MMEIILTGMTVLSIPTSIILVILINLIDNWKFKRRMEKFNARRAIALAKEFENE